MKFVIIDHRLPKNVKSSLSSLGFTLIEMPSWKRLPSPVSAHPDMLLFIAKDRIITHRDYYYLARDKFNIITENGYSLTLSNESVSCLYPEDVLFNSLEIGDTLYGRRDRTSHHITEYASKNGKSFKSVRQGYAKCSVCKVSEKAAITADPSLHKALTENGADTLLVRPAEISLPGYDRGFIGGCSGTTEDTVYFSGNIALHPDGELISEFCARHGKSAVSLSDEPLFDGGSLLFI